MSGELDTELSKGIYVNVGGSWFKAFSEWNSATGGTVTDVDNYNGTGQKWRVHTFTDSGTFTVTNAGKPFRVLVVGGGGGGNPSGQLDPGGIYIGTASGGGGGVYASDSELLGVEAFPVKVGKGGGNFGGGGRTTFLDVVANGGGGAISPRQGGSSGSVTKAGSQVWPSYKGANAPSHYTGGGAGSRGNHVGYAPGPGFPSDINGHDIGGKGYGAGGGYGAPGCGGGSASQKTNPGRDGIVIIAYQIG